MRRTSVRRHIRRTSSGPTAVVRHNRTVPATHGKREFVTECSSFKIGDTVKVSRGPLGSSPIGRVVGVKDGLYYVEFKGGDRVRDIPEKNLKTAKGRSVSDILRYEED